MESTPAKLNVPASVSYCRGRSCHSFADCDVDGECKYKSSGEEFKSSRENLTGVIRTLDEPKGCTRCLVSPQYDPATTLCRMCDAIKSPKKKSVALSTDSAERKDIPLARGLLDYFPAALAEVARLSQVSNEKHNPGEELHHSRGKSSDHADCIARHLLDRGLVDTDGFLHDVKVAWRALAQLQEELEKRGAPLPRGARV